MYSTFLSLLFVAAIGVIGYPIDTDGDHSAFNFGGENAALLLLQNAGAFNQGGGVEQSESGVEQQGAVEGQEGQGEFSPGTDYEGFDSGGFPQSEQNPFQFLPFGVTPEIPPTNNAAMLLAQNGLSSGAFGPFGSAGEKPETQPAVGGTKPGTAPVGFGQNGWNQAGNLFGSMFGGNNGGGQSNVGGMGGQHGPVIGQGTGIAKPSAGGVGIGLGIGAAIQSPLGGFGIGQGSSTSTGK